VYDCIKQFVAEWFIVLVILLTISFYFPIFVLPYFSEQFLDDSFGNAGQTVSEPKNNPTAMLGNSGKPVTLETLSLTKFLRHVFQEQETHDFRKPGTCEASDSRMLEVRESWCGEEMGSRTCGSSEPRAGGGANFGGQSIRESVGDPVRESCAKTCMNLRRSESRFGNLSRAWFGSHT
jgi:hypothetical protein